MKSDGDQNGPSQGVMLEDLARQAVAFSKKARRHSKSLSGDNFYGNKLATLRADAAIAFRALSGTSAGDTSALGELIETVFSPATPQRDRVVACQELGYNLKTIWSQLPIPKQDEGLFPLSILSQTKRGYLVTIGRQMNGAFSMGWHDAAAVMMRRLLEISIIEAFEGKAIAAKVKDATGNYLQLSDLIARALAEPGLNLSRNALKAVPSLRDVGHMSAHGRYFLARRDDLENIRQGCRIVVEEFLIHAGLL